MISPDTLRKTKKGKDDIGFMHFPNYYKMLGLCLMLIISYTGTQNADLWIHG